MSFSLIYGPLYSWRLGRSLGVDPVFEAEKVCNYDCVYCQCGRTPQLRNQRAVFVTAEQLDRELSRIPEETWDCVTFSGRGEPTLALNLGELLETTRKRSSRPLAVITNGSLLFDGDVRSDLCRADIVSVKCDAIRTKDMQRLYRPLYGIEEEKIKRGFEKFVRSFTGRLMAQVMVLDDNEEGLSAVAEFLSAWPRIEIHLNTPTRPCAVEPVSREVLDRVRGLFSNHARVASVFDVSQQKVDPWDEVQTRLRHGEWRRSNRP